jgi:hypothetical protein
MGPDVSRRPGTHAPQNMTGNNCQVSHVLESHVLFALNRAIGLFGGNHGMMSTRERLVVISFAALNLLINNMVSGLFLSLAVSRLSVRSSYTDMRAPRRLRPWKCER